MTKRLLAIALVVMVAVSAMYLPSVLSVSAADTTKVADKAAYEAQLVSYTITINSYNAQTIKLTPAETASPEAIIAAVAAMNLPLLQGQAIGAVEPVAGATNTYNIKTVSKYDIKAKSIAVGDVADTGVADDTAVQTAEQTFKDVKDGSLVSDLVAQLKTPAPALNRIFIGWNFSAIDKNADGKVDAGGDIVAQYAKLTSASVVGTANVFTTSNVLGTDGNPSYATTDTGTTTVYVANAGDPLQVIKTEAGAALSTDTYKSKITVPNIGATHTFDYWLRTDANKYKAIYKKVDTKSYTYNLKLNTTLVGNADATVGLDGSFGKTSADFTYTNDALFANPFTSASAEMQKMVTDYLAEKKIAVSTWTIAIGQTKTNTPTAVTYTLSARALTPVTYYYIDAIGMVAKKVVDTDLAVTAPTSYDAGASKGYQFVNWTKVANENTYNGTYSVGDKVILPAAKNDDNSFAFAKTVSGKKAVYKKTLTPRLTAGQGTFNKTEVKLVNKTVAPTVKVNAINCTAKKGTMTEASGTPVTVTFSKKGTAYVVVSFAYNGVAYTKTMTKTVK